MVDEYHINKTNKGKKMSKKDVIDLLDQEDVTLEEIRDQEQARFVFDITVHKDFRLAISTKDIEAAFNDLKEGHSDDSFSLKQIVEHIFDHISDFDAGIRTCSSNFRVVSAR